MKKMWITLSIMAGAIVFILVGCQATRGGYESAAYKVIRADGKFEVRDYPALMVVETPMTRTGKDADGSFTRLFRFITGGNEAKQKISMTTPVFMSGSGTNTTMAFVLPAKLLVGEVPKPADSTVKVRELPPGRFAVLHFSGGRNAKNEAAALQQLENWMTSEGLNGLSSPVFAYFDPPWTPPFLRRNEVMLRLEAGQ